MKGVIKKIKNIFPVTTTKAVYLDGTDKTLQDAINSGELGGTTTTTTSGRGYVQVGLRGGKVNVEIVEDSSSNPTKMRYYFPSGDSDRMRRLYVWTPSGGNESIEIPDGELSLNDALVYNFDTNTISIKNNSWGNVSVGNNEIILLYNSYQSNRYHICVSGALSSYVSTNYQSDVPIKFIEAEKVSEKGTIAQGIFIIDNSLYTWSGSSDDLSTTSGNYDTYDINNLNAVSQTRRSHFLGHMNSPSYSHTKDMLIVGNGSKIYDQSSLPMKAYICKNVKSVMASNKDGLTFSDMNAIEIDLSQFDGEFKAQTCWGSELGDDIYLLTCDHRILRKLTLGKGSNNLGNGIFNSNAGDTEYNGTFSIDGVWKTWNTDTIGGFIFFKGCLYSGVKGDKGIRKMELCANGQIKNSYIIIENFVGDMQGIDIKNDKVYAYTDTHGYCFDVDNL